MREKEWVSWGRELGVISQGIFIRTNIARAHLYPTHIPSIVPKPRECIIIIINQHRSL